MLDRNQGLRGGLLSVIFLLAILLSPKARTAEIPTQTGLEKLIIAYSSLSGTQAPLWVTYERGFFRKYGLDVQLVYIESGTTTVQSLNNKEVAFAQMAGAGVLQSRLRGSDVVIIAGFLNTMDYQLMVEKGITRPDQLKGKTLAVSRFGSSSDFATRYALEKFGLVPDRDATILEIGSQPARFAALESGKIQAAMVAVPLTLKAKALGFHELADLQMLGLEYQHTGLATTQALLKSRPDLAQSVMRAYAEGIHYYKTHREESFGILGKYMKINDRAVLAEVYEHFGLRLTPQKPYPTVRGVGVMLQELAAKDPKAKGARPEEFVNMSFIKELDGSGFIDRLYAAQPVVATGREVRATPVTATKTKPGAEPEKNQPARTASTRNESANSERPDEYIVVAGDTLSNIALKYYGAQHNWQRIFEANKGTMKNPNYIYVGQRLILPS
jgi:NitT/TauT family transport system substrate-binding protein